MPDFTLRGRHGRRTKEGQTDGCPYLREERKEMRVTGRLLRTSTVVGLNIPLLLAGRLISIRR